MADISIAMNHNMTRPDGYRNTLTSVALATVSAMLVVYGGGCAAPSANTPASPGAPVAVEEYVSGVTALQAGNRVAAVADLEEALERNPQLVMARRVVADIYREDRDYERAAAHYEVAARLDPYTHANHYHLGFSYQMLERFRDASRAYVRAVELLPEDFATNMNLGLAYFSLGEVDPAIFYLERASRIDPQNARVWANLGVVHESRGNAILAEASYRRSLELDPNNLVTMGNLQGNLVLQKKFTDAIAIAEQLIKLQDTASHRIKLGEALTAARRWNEAAAAFDAILARQPRSVPALNGKANLRIQQFDADLQLNNSLRQEAVKLWQESLKIDSNQPQVRELLTRWGK